MSKLRSQFAKRLRKLRRKKDVTQEQLAEAVGISVDFISNMERGINSPSFETLDRLAQALEVEVRELFDFSDE